MEEHDRQRYIPYGASSDEVEVSFLGGPLDGALIRTDILPDCQTFVHRVGNRSYTYRYRRVSKFQFHATLVPAPATEPSSASRTYSARHIVIGTILVLVTIATATGLWKSLALSSGID